MANTGEARGPSKIQFIKTHMQYSTMLSNAVQGIAVIVIINRKFNLTEMKTADSLSYFFTFFRSFCHFVWSVLLAS